jgi:hypothetical protein
VTAEVYALPPPGARPMWDDEAPPDPDDAYEAALEFSRAVEREAGRIRVREAARRLVAAEQASGEPVDLVSLAEALRRPPAPAMRADGLIPADASTLIVAARKTGKTTLLLGLARALLTGEDLLGRYAVRPLAGSVAILNYEVSGPTLARWAHDVGIPADRLHMVHARGRRNPLVDPADRQALAAALRARQVEAVIVDPFGRAYTGASQNDSGEVGAWLVRLDEWVRSDVGATDLVLAAHAGWAGERTRGSSALEDWADVIVTMTRSDDPDDDRRYLRAIGRDVDIDEDRLDYDPTTRLLTLSGAGSRRAAKSARALDDLVVLVERYAAQRPGISTADLVRAIRDGDDAPAFRDREVSQAARLAAERGLIRVEDHGPGRPKRHYSTTPSNPVPTPSTDGPATPSTPSIYGRGGGAGVQDALPRPDGVIP